MTIKELESQAMSLSPEEELRLVDRLLTSLCPDPSIAESRDIEIDRRLFEFDQGRMASKPVEDAIAKARALMEERLDSRSG